MIDDTNHVMTFGKYTGKKIFELMAEDPSYLEWAHVNVERFKLSPRLILEARRNISKQNEDDERYNPEVWDRE